MINEGFGRQSNNVKRVILGSPVGLAAVVASREIALLTQIKDYLFGINERAGAD